MNLINFSFLALLLLGVFYFFFLIRKKRNQKRDFLVPDINPKELKSLEEVLQPGDSYRFLETYYDKHGEIIAYEIIIDPREHNGYPNQETQLVRAR